MLGLLAGLDPNKLSDTVLQFRRGSAAKHDGTDVVTFTKETNVDLSKNGLGGLDQGSPAPGRDYFPYLVSNETTGEFGIIASASRYFGNVVYPPGFGFFLKLPFGVVLDASARLRDFHLSHWPRPAVTYTGVEDRAAWNAIPAAGTSKNAWMKVSLVEWVPDNARLVWLHCEVNVSSGGQPGTAYVRTVSNDGLAVGSTNRPGGGSIATHPIRIRSDRTIEFRTSGDVSLAARVLRYEMTEPTI